MTTSPYFIGSDSDSDFLDDEEEIVVCSDNEFDESGIDDASFAAFDTSSSTESVLVPSEESSGIQDGNGIQDGSGFQDDLRRVMLAIDAYIAQEANQQSSTDAEDDLTFSLPLPGFESLRPSPTLGEHFSDDAMNITTELLEAAAIQCEPHMVVDESTMRSIAHGISLAIGNTSLDGTVGQERYGQGRLVASILINSDTGAVLGYAVAQLVPYVIVDCATGIVLGSILYHETRGFAIDERSRTSVTNATRRPLMNANMIPIV